MPKNPLFSTYRQGENRVTSSMLAVFERIDLSLLETVLAAASGESSLQMVSFSNQPAGQGHSVPDGRLAARFAYWFEVKTTPRALGAAQLVELIENLADGGGAPRSVVRPARHRPRDGLAPRPARGRGRRVGVDLRRPADDRTTAGRAGLGRAA